MAWFAIAAAVISAISALKQGQEAKAAGDYNAAINNQNAQISEQNASDKARQQERETALRLGAVRANQGKNGGTGDSGSVLDVLGDVASQGELERQQIIYDGKMQARGYRNTAALDSSQGSNALTTSYFKAASGALSAYGSAGGSFGGGDAGGGGGAVGGYNSSAGSSLTRTG